MSKDAKGSYCGNCGGEFPSADPNAPSMLRMLAESAYQGQRLPDAVTNLLRDAKPLTKEEAASILLFFDDNPAAWPKSLADPIALYLYSI